VNFLETTAKVPRGQHSRSRWHAVRDVELGSGSCGLETTDPLILGFKQVDESKLSLYSKVKTESLG
jgi:hypothetical protein